MRYRLWMLLLLMAIGPPLIGHWAVIKRHALHRAMNVSASDAAVVAAAATLITIRVWVDRGLRADQSRETQR
jgi:hypothetical protein